MRLCKKVSLTFIVWLVLCAHVGMAQQTSGLKAADTSSPRDTLRSFINACNELDKLIRERQCVDRNAEGFQETAWRVVDCIDSSELPAFAREERTGEVAAALKEVLDRVELPPWDEIPDASQIDAAGGYEQLSRWRIPDTRITIERVEEGARKHEYLFSTGTVDRAVSYFKEIEYRPYRTGGPATSPGLYQWYISAPGSPLLGSIVQRLPDFMRFGSTLGLTNWKWPGLLLLLVLAVGIMWALYALHFMISKRVSPKNRILYLATLIVPVGAMLIPLAFESIAERYLTIRSMPLYVISFSAYSVFLMAAVLTVFASSARVAESIIALPDMSAQSLNAQLIRISSRLIAILLTVSMLIMGGQYLGIPVATLLASAGIGGIAIALSAQDTLKNLFSTITLLADKPCRVGDRIRINSYDGFVEDIGLRSTRLRLLDGHLVTVPNDQIAGRDVENVSLRKYIRRNGEIHIPLDTTSEKVHRAIDIIREKLANHEGMTADQPPRVFFDDFSPKAFRIGFTYWYSPADFWKFKEFSNRLNLEILHAFETEGIPFALPQRYSNWQEEANRAGRGTGLNSGEENTVPSPGEGPDECSKA